MTYRWRMTSLALVAALVSICTVVGRPLTRGVAREIACAADQTVVRSPNVTEPGTDCGTVIGQPADFYKDVYREECQRWLGLDQAPYMVAGAQVAYCTENPDGSVTYQSDLCCPGTVGDEQRCFVCADATYDYQCNYEAGDVVVCDAGQVCMTILSYIGDYPDTVTHVRKSCSDKPACEAEADDNSNSCQSWLPEPTCSYCCEDSFCNMDTDLPDVDGAASSPCVSGPCTKRSTCLDVTDSEFTCICTPGYTGPTCEELVNDVCQNGGVYKERNFDPYYFCECRPGFGGQHCSDVIEQCAPGTEYCLNGGTCMDYGSYGLRCVCQAGYVGALCEREIRSCFDEDSYITVESMGQIEENCTYFEEIFYNNEKFIAFDNYLDKCLSHMEPDEGGTFQNGVDGSVDALSMIFLASCTRGQTKQGDYTRELCCPTCYSRPCQNDGWCVQKDNGDHVCKCRYGYEGKNCEHKVSLCIITGDPHYVTFDEQLISYQGVCKTELASPTDPTLPQFRVTGRNVHLNGNTDVSYPRYIEMSVYGHVIRMDQDVITIDGQVVFPDISYPGFSIIYNGLYARLQTDFGLAVEFDGQWTAIIKAPAAYVGSMQGICGNNNGNPEDDLVTQEGEVVAEDPNSSSEIGNSWVVEDPENLNCTLVDTPDLPPCDSGLMAEIAGPEYCGPMADPTGPFAACLANPEMNYDPFFRSCIYDVCANFDDPELVEELLCTAMETVALVCTFLGSAPDWREELNCPVTCPEGMTYEEMTSSCHATCQNPDAPEQCHLPASENCVCPGDSLLFEDACVEAAACGCYDEDGNHHEIGDEWMSEDCLTIYTCEVCDTCTRPVGQVVFRNHMCPPGEECYSADGATGQCQGPDACSSAPCENGATCEADGSGFRCTCLPGYTDTTCSTDIDDCNPSPCENGGACADHTNGFTCSCPEGFEGSTCSDDVDDCSPNPCANGGTCEDQLNGFTCTCQEGFEGVTCSVDIDECSPNPCENRGGCSDQVGGFTCSCLDGYEGTTCSGDIDDCSPNPCANGGTCEDQLNGFTCTCQQGFEGVTCSVDIDECSPNPCENGGSCSDQVGGFTCSCLDGYEGTTCSGDIDDCSANPCANGGTCEDQLNGFTCTCQQGFEGVTCSVDIDDCSPNPCENGGGCSDQVDGFTCSCLDGYEGTTCSGDVDDCSPNPCANGGTCGDQLNGFTCTCQEGFEGVTCSVDIDDCSPNPCKNGGSCSDQVGGFTCSCLDGYEGTTCSGDIDDCSPNPCANGGTCEDQLNGFTCTCQQGFEGVTCSVDIDDCSPNPCENGGSCSDQVGGFTCSCLDGYEGTTCSGDIDDCSPNPCANGGTCEDQLNGFTCTCQQGFEGVTCSVDIDDCSPNPCENGGSCSDQVGGFTCSCLDGYEGTTCSGDIDDCSPNPCANGGTCEDQLNGFTCTCQEGFEGVTCSVDIDDCSPNPCENGGSCSDQVGGFTCGCLDGYGGTTCSGDIDDCSPNPCANGGTCGDQLNGFTCTCQEGFEGITCSVDIDDCSPNPCENGGSCSDQVGGFTCSCPDGYEGVTCSHVPDIDHCTPNPCENGGICTDRNNGFTCTCFGGYQGDTCSQSPPDACASNPCQNEGTCYVTSGGGFQCQCPDGYSGATCSDVSLDCGLCDYSYNVGYLVDPANCGCFYRCLRRGPSRYHRYPKQCCPPGLLWNPTALVCDFPRNVHGTSACHMPPATAPTRPPTTTRAPPAWSCPYESDPSNPGSYRVPRGSHWVTMPCPSGTIWNQDACTCVTGPSNALPASCDQDYLLYFPFDHHFNDVGCLGAVSDVINSPSMQWDAKKWKSVYFDRQDHINVEYLNNWFVGRDVIEWTVSVWFKLPGPTQGLEGLVNNGNCNNEPSFSLYLEAGNVLKGSVDTVSGPPAIVGGTTVQAYSWNLATLVYDGHQVALYLNGNVVDRVPASGAMVNTQCAMTMGHLNGAFYTGFLDELIIYSKALSPSEVSAIYHA